MLSTKDKAATSAKATAQKSVVYYQRLVYSGRVKESSQKRFSYQIGQLLFSLAAGTIGPGGWRLFEQLLSAHYREGARL